MVFKQYVPDQAMLLLPSLDELIGKAHAVRVVCGVVDQHRPQDFQQASVHIAAHCYCVDMALPLVHGEFHRTAEADHR